MATTYTDTTVNSLIINKMTKSEYDGLTSLQKQANELFLVEETVDTVPSINSTNTITSGAVYTALSTKEDKMPIVTSFPASGALTINTYYRIATALTGAVTITLPEVTETSYPSNIILDFSTASGFTSFTITPPTGVNISYYKDYGIDGSSSYELNLVFNGVKWIVAYGIIL